jgi:hypothetical protein
MAKTPSELIRERLESPDGQATIRQVIADAEASGDPKLVEDAKRLRRKQDATDRQRGSTPDE